MKNILTLSLLGLLFVLTFNSKVFAASTITGVNVGPQTGTVTSGTSGSVTYSISLVYSASGSGSISTTLSLVNWSPPAGVISSFSTNPVSWSTVLGVNMSYNAGTLTMTTTAATPAGTYTFKVRSSNGLGFSSSTVNFVVAPVCINPTTPTVTATVNPTCANGVTTLSIVSGTLNNANSWTWYKGSCGGTSIGSGASFNVSPAITTTYYVRGEGGCVTPGSCGSLTVNVVPASPSISGFTPTSGPIGTLITVTGNNLKPENSFTVGSTPAIVISNDGSTAVLMVMPGTVNGPVSMSTVCGAATSGNNFTVLPKNYPSVQEGGQLSGSGATTLATQGSAVAVSADGNTAIVGGPGDNILQGAIWFYTRSGGVWTQQGDKITGLGLTGINPQFGVSVAISADGNTAIAGANGDNLGVGAAFIFTRSGNVWNQQGNKLVGSGYSGININQGFSVSMSADGNTVLVAGYGDNFSQGSIWVFTRYSGVWNQQGGKLNGSGSGTGAQVGYSVALSADGNTAIAGANLSALGAGGAYVFTKSGTTWSQQGGKLSGADLSGISLFGCSVTLSADGNTAAIGAKGDNTGAGAICIFIRSGGVWSQQGSKLIGSSVGAGSSQGSSVALNADGNILVEGGNWGDVLNGTFMVFTRSGTTWTEQVAKTGSDYSGLGKSIALSANGYTAVVGGYSDSWATGGAWIFVPCFTPDIPTLSGNNICINGSTSLNITNGSLNSATTWQWYSGSCGGSQAGTGTSITVSPTATTTYYVRGEGGCVTPGTCENITITVHPLPLVTFEGIFEDQALCGDPITLTGGSPLGGTYSGTGVSGGMFDPSQAGPGTHTLTYTYTDVWGCTNSATNSIEVMQPETYTYLIGTGADFPDLTGDDGLFAFLNANRRCGDVFAIVLNDLVENGNHALNESVEVIPGNYTLSILPIDETQKLISGNCTQALIRLNGIDRITIDGGKYWPYRAIKFRNTNAGFPTLSIANGVNNCTVASCEIEGNNSDATSGVVVLESSLESNSGILFNRNIIGNISGSPAAPANIFTAKGSGSFLNHHINMQGNEFRNFSSNGINITGTGNGNNWTLYNNSFYATLTFNTNQTGINFSPGASSINNVINTNYIGGSSYQIYGINFINSGSGFFKGICVNSGNTTVSHNSVGNIKMLNIGSPSITGIEILGGTATVNNGNIIGSTNILYSINMMGIGTFDGIKSTSASEVTIKGNTVGNINYSANVGSPKVTCFYMKRGNVDQNSIFNIGCILSTMSPWIYGIYNEANGVGNNITNNMIALKGGNTANPKLFGIYDKSLGNAGSILHNTVSIQGTTYAAATNLTSAFYREGSASVILYNNILYNSKASTVYAKHYAIYSTSTTAITTNYNDLITISPNVVYWGGTTFLNLGLWKNATRDFNSIALAPVFVSASDLHLTAVNVGIDNKGSALYSVALDYDGAPRSITTPDIGCDEFVSSPGFMAPEITEDVVIEPTLSVYPNPINSNATLSVTLGKESKVSIRIYNIVGELIQSIDEQMLPEGTRNIEFNSATMRSGLYICRMIVNNEKIVVKRMEVIR